MKNLKTFVVMPSFIIFLAVVSAFSVKHFFIDSKHIETTALIKAYENLDELTNNADVIVKVKFPSEYIENSTKATENLEKISRVYKIKVLQVLSNTKTSEIKLNEELELYVPYGMRQIGDKNYIPLTEDTDLDFKDGNYLLYLNQLQDGEKTIYMNVSSKNIYKFNEKKKQYENIGSESLSSIKEDEVKENLIQQ